MFRLNALLVIFHVLALAVSAEGTFGQTSSIGLQGKLVGVPDGTHAMGVRFYDADIGGTLVEEVLLPEVEVLGGIFSAAVPVNASTFDGAERWWTVAVDGAGELAPRRFATSVPHSLSTDSMDGGRIWIDRAAGEFPALTVGQPARWGQLVVRQSSNTDFAAIIRNGGAEGRGLWAHGALTTRAVPVLQVSSGSFLDPTPRLVVRSDGLVEVGAQGSENQLKVNQSSNAAWAAEFINRGGNGPGVLISATNGSSGSNVELLRVEARSGAEKLVVTEGGATRVAVLQITGGADLAEHLTVTDPEPTDAFRVLPGMIISIDVTGVRKFKLADEPYDRRRVGIISGGNGLAPGLVLRDGGNPDADGEHPVALTGQVWCHADAAYGAIEPGDLLTTSATPGHAMKATDLDRARFAIVGQALTPLGEGRGWVQVLVGRQ